MCDESLIIDELLSAKELLQTVQERTQHVYSTNDFLLSPNGMILLDSVCMKLLALGELIKAIDRRTNKQLFPLYPSIPWKDVMGMRDIIAHHYFQVDADEIFVTVKKGIPPLLVTIQQIIDDYCVKE
jgi:uncharacterized protein with HEPN domain